MKNISFLLLLILPILFTACKGNKSAAATPTKKTHKTVYFEQSETLTDVLEKAAKEDKLVFVDIVASWCLPCRNMDEDVFTDRNIAKFMNENFINYKVDGEEGNGVNIATIFEVQLYPTLLFLDSRGRVLEKKEGAAYHTELKEMGERAISNSNNGMTMVD